MERRTKRYTVSKKEVFKTDLAQFLYEFSPIKKGDPDESKVKSIVEDFCKRNKIKKYEIKKDLFFYLEIFLNERPSLQLYVDFTKSFQDMGYNSIGIMCYKK